MICDVGIGLLLGCELLLSAGRRSAVGARSRFKRCAYARAACGAGPPDLPCRPEPAVPPVRAALECVKLWTSHRPRRVVHWSNTSFVDIRALRSRDLEGLLANQAKFWQERFSWDCRPGLESVRRMLDRGALTGLAAVRFGRAVGYSRFAAEGRRAVVGDLFVAPGNPRRVLRGLVEGTLNSACSGQEVERVEGHLPCLDRFPSVRADRRGRLKVFPRVLMHASGLRDLSPGGTEFHPVRFSRWSDSFMQPASDLVGSSFRGHVDAEIEERLGSALGPRRCLVEIIRESSCGEFLPAAGFVASVPDEDALVGMCLATLLSARVGHVIHLCVAPPDRRRGIGRELLRRSMSALADAGCDCVSLVVTSSNSAAVRFYERCGFRAVASFPSFVWSRR